LSKKVTVPLDTVLVLVTVAVKVTLFPGDDAKDGLVFEVRLVVVEALAPVTLNVRDQVNPVGLARPP
jgi:hypothetical protein